MRYLLWYYGLNEVQREKYNTLKGRNRKNQLAIFMEKELKKIKFRLFKSILLTIVSCLLFIDIGRQIITNFI